VTRPRSRRRYGRDAWQEGGAVGSRESRAAAQFGLARPIRSVAPLGEGHINATFVVTVHVDGDERRYVLQRINRTVFREPEVVIRNVERVVEHLAEKVRKEGGDPRRRVPTLVRTADGSSSIRDVEGDVWRCFTMIEAATATSTVMGPEHARTVAAAFGRFLERMSDFPLDELQVTIPGYHDAEGHLRTLCDAIGRDPLGRAREADRERRDLEDRHSVFATWTELLSSAPIPIRAIHNDTKINNVLVDDETGAGICVIDLDTVMAGSALVDIGDCARSAMTGPEDTGWDFDLRVFEAVASGYLDETRELLSETETAHIVLATRAIALELASRFLADFILGDRWFPVSRPTQNLERCRVQLELVRGIEANEREMERIVRRATA